MNDQTLMSLLRANRRLEIAELQQWLESERKDCLPITRARQIALNLDDATAQEKAHLARCAHCAKLVEQIQREEQDRAGRSKPPTSEDPQVIRVPGGARAAGGQRVGLRGRLLCRRWRVCHPG
jgi:hypothetical protein